MKNILFACILPILTLIGGCRSKEKDYKDPYDGDNSGYEYEEGTRDPLKRPFSSFSIWNMPIGSDAEYVHAKLEKATKAALTIDEEMLSLNPKAPMIDVYRSDAQWDTNKDRCERSGNEPILSVPLPDDFVVSPATWEGAVPNSGFAALMPDGRTIKQTHPFARCEYGGWGTTAYNFKDEDLFGNGHHGGHGASKLSILGGTLRLGELVKGAGPIKHALKINLFAAKNLYYDVTTKGYRWPALTADGYAPEVYGTKRTTPFVKEVRMGALLALPPDVFDNLEFETEPGQMLAQAFRDYGAYIVDDTYWDVYAICTEWSPDGRVVDEFEENWGFTLSNEPKNSPWGRDMDKIYLNLHVVNNNTQYTIGGGGKPLRPLAPRLGY